MFSSKIKASYESAMSLFTRAKEELELVQKETAEEKAATQARLQVLESTEAKVKAALKGMATLFGETK